MTPTPLSTEFDLSVLSNGQIDWLMCRAGHHRFSTCYLDRMYEDGVAIITIEYDDKVCLMFQVSRDGSALVLL
jgi:hypothetical protein